MRRFALLALFFLSLGSTAGAARANLGPLEPVGDMHRSLHSALGLPEPRIVRLLERGLPEPELPAVGWIAHRTHVPVERVAELRLSGLSFVDVTHRLGHGPEIFYVPFVADPGPPYGKAWGYYRKHPRNQWQTIRLVDADVIHFSNVHLLQRQFGVSPERVVELRRGGKSYAAIHSALAASPGKAKVSGTGKGIGVAKAAGPPGKTKAVKSNAGKTKAQKPASPGNKGKGKGPDKPKG
jgi:hypothetical protein